MLDSNNPDAREEFGVPEEQWEDYTEYEKALVDLEYQIEKASSGRVTGETGPTQEAAVEFETENVIESVDFDERNAAIIQNVTGVLKDMLESDDVSMELLRIEGGTIYLYVRPSGI